MSDQEHAPRDPGSRPDDARGAAQPDAAHVDEPVLVDPDAVQLTDASVSSEALEPQLSVSADGVELAEPSLNPARISEDTARTASLEEIAAETRRVERVAEEAGTLVAGPVPTADAAAKAVPSGTAPAGGVAGDFDGRPTAENRVDDGGSIDDAGIPGNPAARGEQGEPSAETNPDDNPSETPAGEVTLAAGPDDAKAHPDPGKGTDAAMGSGTEPGQSATQPTPVGSPHGLPPAGSEQTRPRRQGRQGSRRAVPSEQQKPGKRRSNRKLLILVGVLGMVALGLLIWGLVSLIGNLTGSPDDRDPIGNATPGADGIIAENVLPFDIDSGHCLRDFVDINSGSTVVTCVTMHNAQLLATDFYADDAEFPDDATLAQRAHEVCDGVDLDEEAAAEYPDSELHRVTPLQGAWADGDRRVDCLVMSSEGNVLSGSLINE